GSAAVSEARQGLRARVRRRHRARRAHRPADGCLDRLRPPQPPQTGHAMSKTIRRLLMLAAVLGVAACHEPYPIYYANPAPPPLMPYAGPVVAVPAVTAKRVVKRRYARRHYRARCRCTPAY